MDGLQFDSLTRRVALRSAVAGAAATAIGLAAIGTTEAKKKKKKKCKCTSLGFGKPCTTNKECCTNETNLACAVSSAAGNSDKTCCGASDFVCTTNDQCCADFSCQSGSCQPVPPV